MNIIGVFNCYIFYNQQSSIFQFYLQDQEIVSYQYEQEVLCRCANCMEQISYSSPEYSLGWKSYEYGALNNFSIRVHSNFICLSEIQLFLTYYRGN